MTYTQEQFDRLPKWARDEITYWQREAEYANELLASSSVGDGSVSWTVSVRDSVGLPEHCTVVFKTKGGAVSCYLQSDGELRVSADRGLTVQPYAYNAINVWNEMP